MKKLIAVFALALTSVIVASPSWAINEPGFANYVIKRSTGAKQSDAVREVRLVRYSVRGNTGQSQTRDLVSNDLVVWDTNSDDGVSIRMTSTSSDGAIAGVVASTTIFTADAAQNFVGEANGARNWGWIVVSGLTTVRLSEGAGFNAAAVGDPFITSRDTGAATTFEVSSNDTTTNITDNIKNAGDRGGFFFDAPSAGDSSVEVFVQLN